MERIKAVDDLLHAIALFVDPLPPDARSRLRFRMGGDGPMLGEYRRLAGTLGLGDCVSWLGLLSRAQARDEFLRCDGFVLTSRHESFGIVFVEAMACGKPVIATRAGGPSWIVDDSTGILVEPGDRPGIAAALRDVAFRRKPFDSRHIRATFERRFSRPAVVDRVEDVYARAVARRRSA
jgi:glycosyltransferase involved in cell wall biosynthesis